MIPEKPKKMDLSMYKMELTVKAICMFERLSGKSFFKFDDEDVLTLMYATFYTSNKLDIKFTTFIGILENEQIANWITLKYKNILDVVQQFQKVDKEEGEEEKTEEDKVPTITDIATSLIVEYGVDAHYVMFEMDLWEIEALYEACDTKIRKKYEEERLWAYVGIMPHIDGKKVKGPEQLVPFPWEKGMKQKKIEENLKNNEYAVKHTIGKNIDDILNGKG